MSNPSVAGLLVQHRVEAACRDQLLVASEFDDAAMVHDVDGVCGGDGGEAVRDDNRGAPACERQRRIADLSFQTRVQCGRRLVEQPACRWLVSSLAIGCCINRA